MKKRSLVTSSYPLQPVIIYDITCWFFICYPHRFVLCAELDSEEDLSTKRIKRILTTDLPMYFALVSRVTRVKQESTVIGMEGGVLSSNVVPQVQAVLPEGTLIRPIPIGLQVSLAGFCFSFFVS